MIVALGLLLTAQLAGEIVARALGLPVPGPVLGLVFLLGAFGLRRTLLARVEPIAAVLLEHLSLLFVPAGVGVVRYGAILREYGVALAAALLLSTALGLATTALILAAFERRRAR